MKGTNVMLAPSETYFCSCIENGNESLCWKCIEPHRTHNYYICNEYDGICQASEIMAEPLCEQSFEAPAQYSFEQFVNLPEDEIKRASDNNCLKQTLLRDMISRGYQPDSCEKFQLIVENQISMSQLSANDVRWIADEASIFYQMALQCALIYRPSFVILALSNRIFELERQHVLNLNILQQFEYSDAVLLDFEDSFGYWEQTIAVFGQQFIEGWQCSMSCIEDSLRNTEIIMENPGGWIVWPQFLLILELLDRVGEISNAFPHKRFLDIVDQVAESYAHQLRIRAECYKCNSDDLNTMLWALLCNGNYKYVELNACYVIHCYFRRFGTVRKYPLAFLHKVRECAHAFTRHETSQEIFILHDEFTFGVCESSQIVNDSTEQYLERIGEFCERRRRIYEDDMFSARAELVCAVPDYLLYNSKYQALETIRQLQWAENADIEFFDAATTLTGFYERLLGNPCGERQIAAGEALRALYGARTSELPREPVSGEECMSVGDVKAKMKRLRALAAGQQAHSNDLLLSCVDVQRPLQSAGTASSTCDFCHEVLQNAEFYLAYNITEVDSLQHLNLWISCGHRFHRKCIRRFARKQRCPLCEQQYSRYLYLLRPGKAISSELAARCCGDGEFLRLPEINQNDESKATEVCAEMGRARQQIPDLGLMLNNLKIVLLYTEQQEADSHMPSGQTGQQLEVLLNAPPCGKAGPRGAVDLVHFNLPKEQMDFMGQKCCICRQAAKISEIIICAMCQKVLHKKCIRESCCVCNSYYFLTPETMKVVNYESNVEFIAPYRRFDGTIAREFYGAKFTLDADCLAYLESYCELGYFQVRELSFGKRIHANLVLSEKQGQDDNSTSFEEVSIQEV